MKTLQHRFVEFMPDLLEEGILYISMEYCTAIHKCVCGCGNKVVTPLSPVGWQLKFDGKSISLSPSIGNWSFKCKSHYFITKNKIKWSTQWNDMQIAKGRRHDLERKEDFFEPQENILETTPEFLVEVEQKTKRWKWKSMFHFLKF